MRYNSLKAVFDGVIDHATQVEIAHKRPLSPDFFIPGGHHDIILKTHTRLIRESSSYADLYRNFKQAAHEMEDSVQTSRRMKLLMKTPSLQFVVVLGPLLFPFKMFKLNQQQQKLYDLFAQTPEAEALKSKPLPGLTPLL